MWKIQVQFLSKGFEANFLSLRQAPSSLEQGILFIAINLYFGAPLIAVEKNMTTPQMVRTRSVKCKPHIKICSCAANRLRTRALSFLLEK